MDNTRIRMVSTRNGCTQTTPFDFVREENGMSVVPLELMLDTAPSRLDEMN